MIYFVGLLIQVDTLMFLVGGLQMKMETEKEREMLQRITKNTIKESTTGQLTEMYYGLVKAISLRSAQGMGTDEALGEMVAQVVAEMNERESSQDLQLPPAA